MKQAIILVSFGVIMVLSSCSQNTDKTGNATWYIGTTGFTGFTVHSTTNNGEYILDGTTDNSAATPNSITVYFATQPIAGNYNVVQEQKAGNFQLASSECAFAIQKGSGDVYLSTGAGNLTAKVSYSGTKITVTYPTMQFSHAGASDTTTGGNGAMTKN